MEDPRAVRWFLPMLLGGIFVLAAVTSVRTSDPLLLVGGIVIILGTIIGLLIVTGIYAVIFAPVLWILARMGRGDVDDNDSENV